MGEKTFLLGGQSSNVAPPKKKKENEKSGKDWRLVCGMGKLTSFCMYHVVYTSLLHLDTDAGWEWGGEAAFFFFWWGKRVLFSSQERVFPDGWSIYESVWGFIPLLLRSFEWTMFFTSTKGTWGSPLEWGILPIAGDPSHRIFDSLPPQTPRRKQAKGAYVQAEGHTVRSGLGLKQTLNWAGRIKQKERK